MPPPQEKIPPKKFPRKISKASLVAEKIKNGSSLPQAMIAAGYAQSTANQKSILKTKSFQEHVAPLLAALAEKNQHAMTALDETRIANSDTKTLVDLIDKFTKLGLLLAGLPTQRTEISFARASDDDLLRIIESSNQDAVAD